MAKNFTVPVLIGGLQDALQRDYHIESTPATYLLDEGGRVVFHKDGCQAGDEKAIEAKIEGKLTAAVADAPPLTASASQCAPAPVNYRLALPAPLFSLR